MNSSVALNKFRWQLQSVRLSLEREIKIRASQAGEAQRPQKMLCQVYKGGSEEESSHHKANLNFIFLSLYVYLFKNCQFSSHWKSAEPVFCSKELSSLPGKKKKAQLSIVWWENSKLYIENFR